MNSIKDTWYRSMQGTEDKQREIFFDLACQYAEPHRYYHNLAHPTEMVSELLKIELADPTAYSFIDLYRAIWWHDCVYDSRAKDNEEKSAEAMTEALYACGVSATDIVRASELVMYTKNHMVPEDDKEGQLMIELDLLILAETDARYRGYADAIRREYWWVKDQDYAKGRADFLRSMLERDAFFTSGNFTHWKNFGAKQNMREELNRLTENQ